MLLKRTSARPLLAIASLVLTASLASGAAPNIVLILADDLGYGDLGCFGSQVNQTPHIDRLAAEGLRFTDFHSNGPMCTPTRAALLTGSYQQRFGVAFDGPLSGKTQRKIGLPPAATTIAEVLQQANYATAMYGKWHLGYEPPFLPTGQGFDEFRGLVSGDGDHHSHIDRSGNEDWWHDTKIEMETGYAADLLTKHAIDFIERHREQPFFLYVPHLAIHFPWQGRDDLPHRAGGTDYWNDKWGKIKNRDNVRPHVSAMIKALDDSVGQIVTAIERLNLDQRTLVIFASDNGGYLNYGQTHRNISSNGPLRGQKAELFEGGHRVPAIAWWPGHVKPGVCRETVMTFDLFPTFCELADLPTSPVDGVSLRRLLTGRETLRPRTLFWRMDDEHAVRRGPWKLVGKRGQPPMLFDLDNDLDEQQDLAADRPQLARELAGAFTEWEQQMPLSQTAVPAPTATDPPNVLFIAVDDLRVELGCYGNTIVRSPHIDRLAQRGMRFTKAYCQQAVCNPSRASLLTGLRPETLRIWDLPTHFRQTHPDAITLPQLFKQHGYHARNIGKIFHNWRQDEYRGDAASWSNPAVMHYATHGSDKPVVEGELPPDLAHVPKTEIRDVPDEAYFDGRIAQLAITALRELKDERFFLAVGFWKPHAHFNAPKKYWDLYDRSQITLPKHPRPPRGVPPIALHDGREILRAFRDRPGEVPTDDDTISLRHGYYAAISYVDAQIGKVIDELDRLELDRKTIIVFWSDHGFHLGEHGLWAKTSNFELDARVPLIIATPDGLQGQTSDAIVELLDLYPTLADLCGLPAPTTLEGKSLHPVLEDPQLSVKPAAFTWHPRPAYPADAEDPAVMGYSMRTPRFRYTEWRDFDSGPVLATELYDHTSDPDETENVVHQHQYNGAVQDLASALEVHVQQQLARQGLR